MPTVCRAARNELCCSVCMRCAMRQNRMLATGIEDLSGYSRKYARETNMSVAPPRGTADALRTRRMDIEPTQIGDLLVHDEQLAVITPIPRQRVFQGPAPAPAEVDTVFAQAPYVVSGKGEE